MFWQTIEEEKAAIDTPVTRLEKQMKHDAGMEGTSDGNNQWRTIAQRVVHGQRVDLPSFAQASKTYNDGWSESIDSPSNHPTADKLPKVSSSKLKLMIVPGTSP